MATTVAWIRRQWMKHARGEPATTTVKILGPDGRVLREVEVREQEPD